MRSLLLLPFLALSTVAGAGEVTVGVAGGAVVMDPLEVLGTGWTVNPRVGFFPIEELGLELESGIVMGRTRIGGRQVGEDVENVSGYPYMALPPRLNVVGRLWTKGVRKDDGSTGDPPRVHPLLVAGIGVRVTLSTGIPG